MSTVNVEVSLGKIFVIFVLFQRSTKVFHMNLLLHILLTPWPSAAKVLPRKSIYCGYHKSLAPQKFLSLWFGVKKLGFKTQ